MRTPRARVAATLVKRHRQLRPVLPRRYLAYPGRGGRIYLDVRESPAMLARALWSYEVAKSRVLVDVLSPGMVFLDIGGNKGDFALLAARATSDQARVLCFEPAPDNARWIERSAQRNGYRSVDVVQVALSDVDGEATLHLAAQSGMHSLSTAAHMSSIGAITVPTRRLDSLMAERGVDRVDVAKIDVEGAEELVLEGAGSLFSGDNPMVLLLDLHPPLVDPCTIGSTLESWGFSLRHPEYIEVPMAPTPVTTELVAVRR